MKDKLKFIGASLLRIAIGLPIMGALSVEAGLALLQANGFISRVIPS